MHDPESPGGAQGVPATLGDLKGLERDGRNFEMVDGEAYNGDKAYKDSKVSTSHHVCTAHFPTNLTLYFLFEAMQCIVYKRIAEETSCQ